MGGAGVGENQAGVPKLDQSLDQRAVLHGGGGGGDHLPPNCRQRLWVMAPPWG